ncbi:MAG: FHA domain-containing protein [Planctomycetes bacterium]|nr:FHA domain-containing protein [Planctomycetota bacterium]
MARDLVTSTQRVAAVPLALRTGGRRHEVPPGATFRLGRHPSNDLVLDERSVSRFHAQVVWVDGRPLLQDLVSTNGTLVDGARVVTPTPLEPGAVVRVGDVVVHAEPGEPGGAAPRPALLDDDEDDAVTLFADRDAEREGVFVCNATLQRVLLDLEWEERTGTLELRLGMAPARVVFCLGRVVTAAHGDLTGVGALERILRATLGGYRFEARFEPSDGSLDLSIREHLRRGYWDVTRRLRGRP